MLIGYSLIFAKLGLGLLCLILQINLLRFLKVHSRFVKVFVDGKPVILIEKGQVRTEECMRYGVQAYELHLKLRSAGVCSAFKT